MQVILVYSRVIAKMNMFTEFFFDRSYTFLLMYFLVYDPHKLPVWRYDTTRHQWLPENPAQSNYRSGQGQQLLRVVTYNILLRKENQPLRFHHLCSILENSRAHIICLQEGK
jgi:hypothetical protein